MVCGVESNFASKVSLCYYFSEKKPYVPTFAFRIPLRSACRPSVILIESLVVLLVTKNYRGPEVLRRMVEVTEMRASHDL